MSNIYVAYTQIYCIWYIHHDPYSLAWKVSNVIKISLALNFLFELSISIFYIVVYFLPFCSFAFTIDDESKEIVSRLDHLIDGKGVALLSCEINLYFLLLTFWGCRSTKMFVIFSITFKILFSIFLTHFFCETNRKNIFYY